MKKILFFLLFWATCFSCARFAEPSCIETPGSTPAVIKTFEVSSENMEEGKATVNPSDGAVSWEPGDAILVSNGVSQAVFTYDESDGKFHNEAGLANTGNFRAWYPASAISFTEAGTQVTLPDTQVYDASAIRSAPMYASSSTTQLNFKNLCAILRFKISGGHSLSTLVFTAASKGVAGDALIADNALTLVNNDTKTLTLTTDGTMLGTETPFYLVLPAQVYTGGFSLQINCSDGWQFEKATTGDLPLRAGVIDGMKAFDAKLFSGGGGTDDNPFLLSTEQDLLDLSAYMNGADHDYFAGKSYLQTENIILTTSNFTPIGNSDSVPFAGHFNGNGQTLYNLQIDGTGVDKRGLFGSVTGGTIENLRLDATGDAYNTINGKLYVGAIVGNMTGGTIRNCVLSRTRVTGSGNNGGVLAGIVQGGAQVDNIVIDASCSVKCAAHAGGIAGRLNRDCTLSNCEVRACSVEAGNRVGGVVGFMDKAAVVNACCSGAILTATNTSGAIQTGGIVGYMAQSTDSSSDVCMVINCVYAPDVNRQGATITTRSTGNAIYVGGIAGASAKQSNGVGSVAIVNCYAYATISSVGGSAGINGFGGVLGGTNCANTTIFNCYTPMMLSNFILRDVMLNIDNIGDYAKVGSICGAPNEGMTIDRVYGHQTIRVYDTNVSCQTTNVSRYVADPAMKNYDAVSYSDRTDFPSEVASYPSFKEALDAGVAAWNANNPAVQALPWTADVRLDGYLKPDGVYKPAPCLYKKVSIIGDSISTFGDFIFYGYNKYYPYAKRDVMAEQNTWWWKLIYEKMTNARLEVDNAYSGSSCCQIDANTPNYSNNNKTDKASTTYCFFRRYRTAGIGNPDLVIIYGGRNDFGKYTGDVGTDDYLGSYTDSALESAYQSASSRTAVYRNFSAALTGLIREISLDHPNARFLIICHDMMSDGYEAADNAIAAFLQGKGLDVRFVSLHETGTHDKTNEVIGITKNAATSCHPDDHGTTAIANYVYSQVGSWLDQ